MTVPFCATGKWPYPSKGAARAAIRAVKARRNPRSGRRVERHIYACEVCGGWHTTSKAQP